MRICRFAHYANYDSDVDFNMVVCLKNYSDVKFSSKSNSSSSIKKLHLNIHSFRMDGFLNFPQWYWRREIWCYGLIKKPILLQLLTHSLVGFIEP